MNAPTKQPSIQALIDLHKYEPGALLPLLHDVQNAYGYISDEVIDPIAKALNLSRAEVFGVVTYYHFFRRVPPAKHLVQVCRAEACQARGANQLIENIERKLGCKMHEHTVDGSIGLEPIYCLGQCAVGPAVLVDETTLHARVDLESFDGILEKLGATK